MNCFCHGFNMNYMYGANMFGGWFRPVAFRVMDPFWAGAINTYRASMSNLFMMNVLNQMFSSSLFAMPQMNYNPYPSYNNSFNYVPPTPAPRSSNMSNSGKYEKVSNDWDKAYKELMESFEKKEEPTRTSVSTSSVESESRTETSSSSTSTIRTETSTTRTTTVSRSSNHSAVTIDMSQLKRNFSPEFINKTKEVARNLNCDWKDLMALMQAESGINPQAWNGNSAVGLIQFTDDAVAELNRVYGLNLTKEKIAQMSDVEQLDLVEKYLKHAKSYKFSPSARLSAGDLYAITLLPGRADREILTTRGERYYNNNPIDEDNDGVISKQDLEKRLQKKRLEVFA